MLEVHDYIVTCTNYYESEQKYVLIKTGIDKRSGCYNKVSTLL